jgi:isopenicillin-N N-acyltransferase like protein
VGKIGLNGHGLAVALNFLATTIDSGEGGLPVHVLARQLLQQARDLTDALGMLTRAGCRVSICFTLAFAAAGDAAIVSAEVAPDGVSHCWPNAGGVLVHANHFRVRRRDDRFLGPDGHHDTLVREWYAERALGAVPIERAAIEATLSSCFNAPHGICQEASPREPWVRRAQTLASIVMDVSAGRMWIAEGRPVDVPYVEVDPPHARADPTRAGVTSWAEPRPNRRAAM